MQLKFTPLIKGLITGVIMVVILLAIFYLKQTGNNNLQYLIYAVYAGGITWALLGYFRSPAFTGKFSELFGQGFRCFIVAILVLVLFVGIFNNLHPEFAEEAAVHFRADLVKKGNLLPPDIDVQVASFKKQYTLTIIYSTIFGYLIIGALLTAAGAGLLILRRK